MVHAIHEMDLGGRALVSAGGFALSLPRRSKLAVQPVLSLQEMPTWKETFYSQLQHLISSSITCEVSTGQELEPRCAVVSQTARLAGFASLLHLPGT